MANYPGIVPIQQSNHNLDETEFNGIRVRSVPACFKALPNAGQFSRTKFSQEAFPPYRLTSVARKKNKLRNHFQGIVRLRDGIHFLASVGDVTQEKAVLVLFKQESHIHIAGLSAQGPTRSNMIFSSHPGDEIVEFFEINKGEPNLWHPGSIGIMGDVVATPLEDFKNDYTRVDFYNFQDPLHPVKMNFSIECNERYGAVGIDQLPNGQFICILYSDPLEKFRIYLSKSTDLSDGFYSFEHFQQEVRFTQIANLQSHHADSAIQAVHIIQDEHDDLYITISGNFSIASPTINGSNFCTLIKLDYDRSNNRNFLFSYQDHLIVDTEDDHSNFDAGVGIYIPDPDRLAIYSIYHWRAHRYLKWAEYYGRTNVLSPTSNNIEDAFIEMYVDENYLGKSLNLYGLEIVDIPDYSVLSVQKDHFNDQVRSIRYRLPAGTQYTLFEHVQGVHPNHQLILSGSGNVEVINDLSDVSSLSGRVSSSMWTMGPS